ncbi:MAG: folate family ECF transporter S component [Clostridia bacterium]|nr:folate family ECF transporter S component [Clostridia bacterium]MBR3680459.1 folate family ECF transporter S component [Clostridia bacterium]
MTRGIKGLKQLTLAAMLTAMSVVIGYFCKTALNFGDGLVRITFENLPIIIAGITLGPIWGGAVGLASDLLSYVLSGQAYAPIILVTVGATLVGVVSGAVAKLAVKERGSLQIIAAGGLAHLIGSMIVKPIGLFSIYGWAVLIRIPVYLVIAPLEIFLICLLFKNKTFRRVTEELDK